MVARQVQQHADARVDMEHSVAQLQVEMDTLLATIRDKDREIARLKTDTTSASVMASRVSCPLPDAAEHGPCEAARFLTIADAARLSQASSFILVICKTFISRSMLPSSAEFDFSNCHVCSLPRTAWFLFTPKLGPWGWCAVRASL